MFFNFIQPSKPAEFHKINKNENNQLKQSIWSKSPDNKISSNTSKLFLENNSTLLLTDSNIKQEELIIESDKQSEKNNVIYAEGNVCFIQR